MNNIRKMTLTSMLFAVGLVLPFFTAQIPQVGSMLLPMHIPVFLCGLICGWKYGLMMVLMGISGGVFTMEMFMAGAFLNAIPGIAVQLVMIPAVMFALGKTKLISFGMAEPA